MVEALTAVCVIALNPSKRGMMKVIIAVRQTEKDLILDHLASADALANIALSKHLERELRSDHAGETGAVSIYEGIVAVSKWRNKPELVHFAQEHGQTEVEHLNLLEQWLPLDKRSRLLGPWRLAGWLTGAIPALFGQRAVYATIAAVETFVDHHYQQQVDHIQKFGAPPGLLSVIVKCQADECHHRDEAKVLVGPKTLPMMLRLWCAGVGAGSAAAVVLARRV
jgi:ubiquinone biosynthesis monooxygenase Coq7